MNKLINRPVKRFFAFGCSFTGFVYPTWADIIGYDLQAEFYNYGKSGAGDQYIFNMIMQADSFYNFNEDDLIIVEWTSVSREDRYKNYEWVTPGNIYTQKTYDTPYVNEWADFEGYLIRDLASIKAVSEFLQNKKSQHHMLSMAPIATTSNDWYDDILQTQHSNAIIELYKPYLDRILPNFYQVLWNGSIRSKVDEEIKLYSQLINGHPTILEHYKFLLKTFDHQFSENTINAVNSAEQGYQHIIKNANFRKENPLRKRLPELFFATQQDIKHL